MLYARWFSLGIKSMILLWAIEHLIVCFGGFYFYIGLLHKGNVWKSSYIFVPVDIGYMR